MLSAKSLKAAQKALRHFQAIDEILKDNADLKWHRDYLKKPWEELVYQVVTTLRDNPGLGSTLLPMIEMSECENAKASTQEDTQWLHTNLDLSIE